MFPLFLTTVGYLNSRNYKNDKNDKIDKNDFYVECILCWCKPLHQISARVYGTQKAMSMLFDCDRSVVTKHLKNIFDSNKLSESSVCAKNAHTASDGKKYQTQFYNLDAVISINDIPETGIWFYKVFFCCPLLSLLSL